MRVSEWWLGREPSPQSWRLEETSCEDTGGTAHEAGVSLPSLFVVGGVCPCVTGQRSNARLRGRPRAVLWRPQGLVRARKCSKVLSVWAAILACGGGRRAGRREAGQGTGRRPPRASGTSAAPGVSCGHGGPSVAAVRRRCGGLPASTQSILGAAPVLCNSEIF